MGVNATATEWIRILRKDPAASGQLVCFPPGGGSAAAYREAEEWRAVTDGPFT